MNNFRINFFIKKLFSYFERFFSYIKDLADVSVTQGNKDLIFGAVDCKEDNALCQQYDVTQDLELKQFDIRSPNLELVLKYIKDLIDEFLREEVTKNFIQRKSGKAFVFYKIKKCKFCNQIFKYWPTVVDHFKDSDIHIGTIDCHHYRDLCDICDVTGYPRLHMVIDGKCGERQTGGERDANTIINFIDDQVEKNS